MSTRTQAVARRAAPKPRKPKPAQPRPIAAPKPRKAKPAATPPAPPRAVTPDADPPLRGLFLREIPAELRARIDALVLEARAHTSAPVSMQHVVSALLTRVVSDAALGPYPYTAAPPLAEKSAT